MRKKENLPFAKIEHHRTETFFLIVRGLEVGVVAGLVSALYRFLLSKAESANHAVLTAIAGKPLYIALFLAALAGIGYLVSQLVRWQPLASSSGIPQITGEIRGHMDAPWWQVLLAKIAGGTLSILSGLSLGREGPSIQLGGMAAKRNCQGDQGGQNHAAAHDQLRRRRGLAAAFNAPLAGMMFTLEEIHKTLDGNILCMGIVSTITADYISKLFFGQNTVFHYTTADIPLKSYWILLLLGIVLGLAGVGYNALMLLGQKWIGKIKAPVRMMLVFVLQRRAGAVSCPNCWAGATPW